MKKHIRERRERNRRLAESDAKQRCAFCKRELPTQAVRKWDEPERYCDEACLADADERKALI